VSPITVAFLRVVSAEGVSEGGAGAGSDLPSTFPWPRSIPSFWSYGPAACLTTLIAAAAFNGTSISVHGLSVYPEYIALGVVLVWVGAATLTGQLRPYIPKAAVPLALWLGVELLATLLYAPQRHHSLILWLKLPLMVATFLVVANLARGRVRFTMGIQWVAASGVALAAIGAYVSWKLTGSHLGMSQQGRNFGTAWLPESTLREPDILGSYLLAAALMALPVALFLRRSRIRVLVGTAAGLAILGVAVSGSRTAWLSLLAVLCVPLAVWAAAHPHAVARRSLLPLLALAGGIIVLIALHVHLLPAFNPQQNAALTQRVASFGSLSHDRNVIARIEIARNALNHWRAHPFTGWGVGAYGEVYRYPPPDTIHAGWISNLPIHLLYDSGLLGLAAFAAAIGMAAWYGIRSWLAAGGLSQAMLAGILLALLGLLVAFQATEATWFAYPWIYLGLLEAATRSLPSRQRPTLEIV
jgi:O-antigen ligase